MAKESILDVEKKIKLEVETIYKNKELNVNVLTKILNIPLVDIQNILGVENK